MLYPSEHEILHRFIRKLAMPLCLSSENLIAVRSFFPQIVDHVRATERAYIKTYEGGEKRPCHLYSAIGILFSSENHFDRDQPHL